MCRLIVQFSKVKPFIIRGPYDQTVVEGSSVTFQCRVGGEPIPDILWYSTLLYLHCDFQATHLYIELHFSCFFLFRLQASHCCRWQHAIGYIKFISKLYTLIKSNQFVSELVSGLDGLNFRWIAFSLQF